MCCEFCFVGIRNCASNRRDECLFRNPKKDNGKSGGKYGGTEQPVGTSTAAEISFFQILGGFAEFETNLHRERQMEGIAEAKAEGVYKGRKPSIDVDEVKRLRDVEGLGATQIARQLGVARSTVYRVLE
ncbi:helix-turn-helix domain-containing protein [Falsihalocynthiibacter sp. SS001]|uniref:helix-turn-helix domain-containing protein n=1 Tax=Falsihalocynthiibacter sp. SS001 TaxID=3349698 RepID=UPI0036D2296A